MLRVRQITDALVPNMQDLTQVLPANIESLFNSNTLVKYPPFVYKLKYKWIFSHYGIFMETLIRKMLSRQSWRENLYELYFETMAPFIDSDIIASIKKLVVKQDLYSCMGRFVNVEKFITSAFPNTQGLKFNQELSVDCLSGHPDLIYTPTNESGGYGIYDIKTTTKFNTASMRYGSILQLSAYLALASRTQKPTIIGIILPMQQLVLEYDLTYTEYDHKPFLKMLLEIAHTRHCTLNDLISLGNLSRYIGDTIKKHPRGVARTLHEYYDNCDSNKPCQIFMRGNISSKKITVKDSDIAETSDFIANNDIKVFVHAPYIINLCHPCGNKTFDNDPWAIRLLREELDIANTLACSGVVVHTGKGLDLSEIDATEQMRNSLLEVLESATDLCPCLIETPVDKGSELLGTPESLAEFYKSFENNPRLGVCVDTCHVFAAGYLPMEYLLKLTELIGVEAIKLIHLNDSQWLKGSGRDGHAPIGSGYIGITEMIQVITWCIDKNIPMVRE